MTETGLQSLSIVSSFPTSQKAAKKPASRKKAASKKPSTRRR